MDAFSIQVETIKSTLAKAATELGQRTAQSGQAKLDLDAKRWEGRDSEKGWMDGLKHIEATEAISHNLLSSFLVFLC